jgi:hypothetical protein
MVRIGTKRKREAFSPGPTINFFQQLILPFNPHGDPQPVKRQGVQQVVAGVAEIHFVFFSGDHSLRSLSAQQLAHAAQFVRPVAMVILEIHPSYRLDA